MKRLLLIIVALSWTLLSYGQGRPMTFYEEERADFQKKMVGTARHYVGVHLGSAMPESAYSSSWELERAGYAKTGVNIGIDGTYLLQKNIGLSATLSTYSNPIKLEDYSINVLRELPESVDITEMTTKRWRNTFLAVGPTISLPEKKVTFDLRCLVGLLVTKSPAIALTGMYSDSLIKIEREKTRGVSPTLVLGGTLSYPIPVGTGFDFRAFVKGEYIGASPKLNFKQAITGKDLNIESAYKGKQPVSVFSLSVGIRYDFGYSSGTIVK